MNDLAREKLIQAQLRGVKQIYGNYFDERGGFCAMGILEQDTSSYDTCSQYGLRLTPVFCPECGEKCDVETTLIIHLNDVHKFDFLTIARKMP